MTLLIFESVILPPQVFFARTANRDHDRAFYLSHFSQFFNYFFRLFLSFQGDKVLTGSAEKDSHLRLPRRSLSFRVAEGDFRVAQEPSEAGAPMKEIMGAESEARIRRLSLRMGAAPAGKKESLISSFSCWRCCLNLKRFPGF